MAGEVAAFPLAHRGSVYGFQAVQTPDEYSFREQKLAGVATLAKTIGFARNAITNKKLREMRGESLALQSGEEADKFCTTNIIK